MPVLFLLIAYYLEPVFLVFVFIAIALTLLMCLQESKRRRINFFFALLICIVATPLLGYFLISMFGLRNPRGCKWCGNKDNEAEYCGICGKNEEGVLKG
jgi:hypothetical protein